MLGLHTLEQAQGRVDAGLGRFPIAADDPKLRVAAAQEEAGPALGTVVLIVAAMPHHWTAAAIAVTIHVSAPSVSALTPAAIEVITIPR